MHCGVHYPQQSIDIQPKSPMLNIMPTPKAVQPLTTLQVGGLSSFSSAGVSHRGCQQEDSIQNTCIKNP
jgi:hypothetical protein